MGVGRSRITFPPGIPLPVNEMRVPAIGRIRDESLRLLKPPLAQLLHDPIDQVVSKASKQSHQKIKQIFQRGISKFGMCERQSRSKKPGANRAKPIVLLAGALGL